MSVGTSFPLSEPYFSRTVVFSTLPLLKIIWVISLVLASFVPFSMYPRFWIVEIVGAYVDGLPIPKSSNFFTKLASLYLPILFGYSSLASISL